MTEDRHEPYGFIRKMLPFTTLAVVLVALYVGYLVFTRWKDRRDIAQKENEQTIANARKDLEQYGSGLPKILNFSLSQGAINKGDKISICYGVSNAKQLTIEPKPDENVWPSVARCVAATPTKTTTYVITAKDDAGHSDTQSLTVNVVK
ncbi:MAG TPA: hypothetical protein VFP40_12690 [Terriglobales bacterium]|nr:hypothetical protein [Terriglobales bacterium]